MVFLKKFFLASPRNVLAGNRDNLRKLSWTKLRFVFQFLGVSDVLQIFLMSDKSLIVYNSLVY